MSFSGNARKWEIKLLQEAQRTLTKNEVFRLFRTACPTHKACKIANGITLHRVLNVNPIGYPYEYTKY